MSPRGGRRSFWQRIYDRLFKIYGPAQISARDAPQTGLTTSEVQHGAELDQWERETDGTHTWLVRRKPK
jgi:hypothetical protein